MASQSPSHLAPKTLFPAAEKSPGKQFLQKAFEHLDGIGLIPTMVSLNTGGVLSLIPAAQDFEMATLSALAVKTKGAKGYIGVGLRAMASQGWMEMKRVDVGNGATDWAFRWTRSGEIAREYMAAFEKAAAFIPAAAKMDQILFDRNVSNEIKALQDAFDTVHSNMISRRWDLPRHERDPERERVRQQVLRHLDGIVVGPIMVALARRGILEKFDAKGVLSTEDFINIDGDLDNIMRAFGMLQSQKWKDWLETKLTPEGMQAIQKPYVYGVPVSYYPTFARLHELTFVNPDPPRYDANKVELLVDRKMNTWGSGEAHKNYFRDMKAVIKAIFDNEDYENQPKGICDVGCGNGTFLKELYEIVKKETKRGKMLDQYPLKLVGVDYNPEALETARKTLEDAGLEYSLLEGDIRDPDQIAKDLKDRHQMNLADFLSVRSFLDHNRPWEIPENLTGLRQSDSTGIFCHRGEEISNDFLELDLRKHFARWAKHVQRFGLLALDLHTIPPELAARHRGETAAIAYDTTHGYSDQYIIELPLFLAAAKEAGLEADVSFRKPDSELATISLTYFKASGKKSLLAPPTLERETTAAPQDIANRLRTMLRPISGAMRLPGINMDERKELSFDKTIRALEAKGMTRHVQDQPLLSMIMDQMEKHVLNDLHGGRFVTRAVEFFEELFPGTTVEVRAGHLEAALNRAIELLNSCKLEIHLVPTLLQRPAHETEWGFHTEPGNTTSPPEMLTDNKEDASNIPILVRRLGNKLFIKEKFFEYAKRNGNSSTLLWEVLAQELFEDPSVWRPLGISPDRAHAFAAFMREVVCESPPKSLVKSPYSDLEIWMMQFYSDKQLAGLLSSHPGIEAHRLRAATLDELLRRNAVEEIYGALVNREFLKDSGADDIRDQPSVTDFILSKSRHDGGAQHPSAPRILLLRKLAGTLMQKMNPFWQRRHAAGARQNPYEYFKTLYRTRELSHDDIARYAREPGDGVLVTNIMHFLVIMGNWEQGYEYSSIPMIATLQRGYQQFMSDKSTGSFFLLLNNDVPPVLKEIEDLLRSKTLTPFAVRSASVLVDLQRKVRAALRKYPDLKTRYSHRAIKDFVGTDEGHLLGEYLAEVNELIHQLQMVRDKLKAPLPSSLNEQVRVISLMSGML